MEHKTSHEVLLRSKKDRVSRSVRAKWFLDHVLNEGKINRDNVCDL